LQYSAVALSGAYRLAPRGRFGDPAQQSDAALHLGAARRVSLRVAVTSWRAERDAGSRRRTDRVMRPPG
jgi:hypothetical protein